MSQFVSGTICLSLYMGSKSTAAYSTLVSIFNLLADLMAIGFGAFNILVFFRLIGDGKTGLPPPIEDQKPESTSQPTTTTLL